MGENNFDKEKISQRIADIAKAFNELQKYEKMDVDEFLANQNNFPLASYWLRLAIEAVLTIAVHILSRLPQNGKDKDYTQVLVSLGDYGVISVEFAKKIRGMAGYRNRLVHLYWEVEPEELLNIIKENLPDFEEFIGQIKSFISQP